MFNIGRGIFASIEFILIPNFSNTELITLFASVKLSCFMCKIAHYISKTTLVFNYPNQA